MTSVYRQHPTALNQPSRTSPPMATQIHPGVRRADRERPRARAATRAVT